MTGVALALVAMLAVTQKVDARPELDPVLVRGPTRRMTVVPQPMAPGLLGLGLVTAMLRRRRWRAAVLPPRGARRAMGYWHTWSE